LKNGGGARITHTLDFLAGKHCEEEEERKKNKKNEDEDEEEGEDKAEARRRRRRMLCKKHSEIAC